MLTLLAGIALQAATNAVPAAPPPPPPRLHGGPGQMTCPIGGERFEVLETDDYVTSGSRPDGRENTFWYAPLPLPECPSNGLVIFREFTPAQIQALRPLIASVEYRRLIAGDSTYYRAQWLATRIGVPEQEALWLLLLATWQVKPARGAIGQPMESPAKAEQYQREFVARVRALPASPDNPSYVILFARAANAERELGHFQNAAAMLRMVRNWVAQSDPRQWENADSEPQDWQRFATDLGRVIARHDSSVDPLDMMDDVDAAWTCLEGPLPATTFNRAYCRRPQLREGIATARRMRAEDERQSTAQPPHPPQ